MVREKQDATTATTANCLVKVVAEAMKEQPALEAVKFNRDQKSIALATLGKIAAPDLEQALASRIQTLESGPAGEKCRLLEGAADCANCARIRGNTDLSYLQVKQDPDFTTVLRVTCPTAPRFWFWQRIPWPRVVPRTIEIEDIGENEWKWQLVAASLCAAFGISGYLLKGSPAGLAFYAAAYLAGAWFAAHEVWERLRERILDVHFLMLAVAAGSALIGGWAEGSTLLFLFSFSGALEHYAMGRTQREIRSLFKTAPKEATLVDADGNERRIPVAELVPGLRLLIKPGDQFPVDAEIAKGSTAADESNLTGEAVPVEKAVGDSVLAGTINLWGAVEVTVLRSPGESALQKIIKLIREAQHLKAPSQNFTDKFGTRYTYGILGLSFAMFFVWWLGFGHAPFASAPGRSSAFYRTMTLLVVASPCALVLSIPSAILAAIAWSARRGILFRGGAAVERLAEVTVVAMDKTGTLTTGDLQVSAVESFPPGRESEVARLAYALERLSTHPLARAITRHGRKQGFAAPAVESFESENGMGVKARVGADLIVLGRREWVEKFGDAGLFKAALPPAPGLSEVWLAGPGFVGRLLLQDDIRAQAKPVLEELKRLGLRTVVLTGDRKAVAERLASELPVDDLRCELKPEGKVAAIKAFSDAGKKVAMVGDGVNDAPSLAAAYVGVAMGARGADAAMEQAEIVLMHDRLENFLTAYRLSKRARAVIWQNLAISLGAVVVLVLFALAGKVPLTLGVLGHEGSTVVVVLNSLRLLFGSGAGPAPGVDSVVQAPSAGKT